MPQRWGIRFAIDGDLRFLSHHDMMRTVERTALRAGLPLRYSQGFNPRPAISLICPRPVGVATRADVLIVTLDEPVNSQEIVERMNAQAPTGMRLLQAELLTGKKALQPTRVTYELPLPTAAADNVRDRLQQLTSIESWPVQRRIPGKPRRRSAPSASRQIDLKPLIADVRIEASGLRLTLQPAGDAWARPGEVLRLLGLNERTDLAATVRTKIELTPSDR